jgi:hypothetical protein
MLMHQRRSWSFCWVNLSNQGFLVSEKVSSNDSFATSISSSAWPEVSSIFQMKEEVRPLEVIGLSMCL